MGCEISVGCTSCRIHIWLGSNKPWKWEGFQVGESTVKRFFDLHSLGAGKNCRLLLTNDCMAPEPPWEEENEESLSWKEDVASRSFWNSWSQEGMKCSACGKVLLDPEGIPQTDNHVQRSYGLLTCDEACLEAYLVVAEEEWRTQIHDSGHEAIPEGSQDWLEVGCTACRQFCRIDGHKLPDGTVRDFLFLHEFMNEHFFHEFLIAENGSSAVLPPWRRPDPNEIWEEYVG